MRTKTITLFIVSVLIINFACVTEQSDAVEPDALRNISQLISSKGYPVEEHEVLTGDGYILGVQRIPHGRNQSKTNGYPVLLHHGMLSSGVDFVYNFPEQSLGFILADAGYDVWITNARGTRYSRKHSSLSPKSREFWNFSWQEMALVDLPSTIDYILSTTGHKDLFYAGHSMGTTVMFALLSENVEFNEKVRVAVAMAPVALLGNTDDTSRFIVRFLKEVEVLLELFGHGEFLPDDDVQQILRVAFCETALPVCYSLAKAMTGMSTKQLNLTRVPVYLASTPDGISVHTLVHYGQLIKSGNFQKYDFGPEENLKKYNQTTPPEFALGDITSPLVLMWGLSDKTADPTDVNLLSQKLKSVILNYEVPDPEWSHDDFAIGLDANKLVYQKIVETFNNNKNVRSDL